MTSAVFIATYKNRKNNLVEKFCNSEFSSKKPVYFVCYDFDFEQSGYGNYKLPENCKWLKINIERDFSPHGWTRSLQSKRRFIQQYCEDNGIAYFWEFDDDLEKCYKKVEDEIVECSFDEALGEVEDLMTSDPEVAICGASTHKSELEEGVRVEGDAHVYNAFLCNTYVLQKNDIYWDPDENASEDREMIATAVLAGCRVLKLTGRVCFEFEPYGGTNSIANKYGILVFNIFKKLGRCMEYRLSPNSANGRDGAYVSSRMCKDRIYKKQFRLHDDFQLQLDRINTPEDLLEFAILMNKKNPGQYW